MSTNIIGQIEIIDYLIGCNEGNTESLLWYCGQGYIQNLNLIMKNQRTTQIEGHSTKQVACIQQKYLSHKSQGKTEELFQIKENWRQSNWTQSMSAN